MSELIKYLESFATPELAVEAINEELGVKVKRYDSGLFVFNYSQIDSPKTHPVVVECRGAILEYLDTGWHYLCRPFKRFFNYGEAPDTLTDFDFNRAEVMEKADGSLVKLWADGGHWFAGTRGTAFAESENYTGEVFADLVYDAFGLGHDWGRETSDNLPRGMTHLYEFISPENRVVTPYEKAEMVYLGSVDNDTGEVDYIDSCLIGNAREVETYSLQNIESCVEAAKTLSGLAEGFVVRDLKSGQMVKIKSPLYVAAHHMLGDLGLTPKKIAKLVVTNETDEYLKYFPEDRTKIGVWVCRWDAIQAEIFAMHDEVIDIESQKDFAMAVKGFKYSGILFMARKNEEHPKKVLHSSKESFKIDLLLNWGWED